MKSLFKNPLNMKYPVALFSFIFSIFSINSFAQPYIDLVNTRFTTSPANTGINKPDDAPVDMQHAVAGFNIPIPLNKKQTDAIIFLPYAEQWKIDVPGNSLTLQGIGLPLGLQKSISEQWRITGIVFYRYNTATDLPSEIDKKHQWGTAIIANYIKKPTLTYKFGVYYNREFFGNFVMVLLGLDWQLNSRNAIFGTLPGAITWESKVSNKFYYGANFRAITNSYRYALDNQPAYISIDENQLGAYADYYIGKHIVINAEIGHSILRKVKAGLQDQKKTKATMESSQDNLYFRVMAAYRLRLR